MDIRQLKYFIAAAEAGHLGRAAARLHLSQPALTRQIQLMEASLGAELFTRTPRGVALTQAGQTLLRDARNVLKYLDLTLERTRRAGRGIAGELDVGIFGTAAYDYVPRLFARLARTHPEVNVTLHHEPAEQLIEALRQGRVLVVFERRVVNEPDIVSRVATREPAVLATSDRNPLAKKRSVAIASLQQEPLVIGRAIGRPRGTMEFCREHGFEPRTVRESMDMTTGLILVATGVGSAIVPRSLTNLHMPGVVYRPLIGESEMSFDLYCYHLKAQRSPLLDVLLETVAAMAAA